MSLFKARDWWATYCGNDEEFDTGCISVSNIDNNSTPSDKIVVGSYHGILRIFHPRTPTFKPEDLMLEMQLQQPILQVECGKFVSGSDKIQLAILHPRKLAIFNISSVSGAVDHGNHYSLNLVYEHILERSAFNMTFGPFGGVKGKDFICVQSVDGMLSFFEQESFAFGRFIPNFLLPGPMTYVMATDSFILCNISGQIESYKYQTLAVATNASNKEDIGNKNISGKKLTVDWFTNIGENSIDIQVFTEKNSGQLFIVILGERSIFCLRDDGTIRFMKKLEYNPSSILVYHSTKEGSINLLVATHTKSLLVYQDVTLVWAAQLPHIPVAVKVATFQDLEGVIVTLDEIGYIHCAYLGTDPSLMVTPAPDARDINYEESDDEMKDLQRIIRESNVSSEILPKTQQKEDLLLKVHVPTALDTQSQSMVDEGDEIYPSITVTITLECQALYPIENVVLNISADAPLSCNRNSIVFSIIGDRKEPVFAEVAFYSRGGIIPASLRANITATYSTSSEAPRVAQQSIELPLLLVCKQAAPMKAAVHKLTIETNKSPANLAEIFPDMVDNAVIPLAAIGIQYYGGPIVTVLASKTSQRYRIQCDKFEGMWLVLSHLVQRLDAHFRKIRDNVAFRASFMGPLPMNDYNQLIDAHFELRKVQVKYRDMLANRAQQFRSIQRRLLTRFKDKTPAPLQNLDTLLDGTYRQLLHLSEAEEDCKRELEMAAIALSSGTRLVNFLIKLWTNMSEKDFEVLETAITPLVTHNDDQGWEEMVDASISHLLRTCLSKNVKDQAVSISPLTMPQDLNKLKKHMSLLCDRLNKGGKLDLSMSSGQQTSDLPIMQQQKQVKPLEPLDEMQEEDDDGNDMMSNGSDLPPLSTKNLNKRLHVAQGSSEEGQIFQGVEAALMENGHDS